MSVRIGEVLIRYGHLSVDQLREALHYQKVHSSHFVASLVSLGFVTEDTVVNVLSRQYNLPVVDLSEVDIDINCLRLIPRDRAVNNRVLPLKKKGAVLKVAVTDPSDVMALDELKFMTGCRIDPVIAKESSIIQALEEYLGSDQTLEIEKVYNELIGESQEFELDMEEGTGEDQEVNIEQASEAPIIRLVNLILADSMKKNASDIHLESYQKDFRIRFRIDGVLYPIMSPPIRVKDAVVSRIKIMANLDIGERRMPQDGRIRIQITMGGRKKKIDFRVSTLPTLYGEKVVLRLLDSDKLPTDMRMLGFEKAALERFERAVSRPYGMVLVTGPTGSGKTSTLYTSLAKLNTDKVNIMTAEDPVEFNFHGINQVQINEQVGRTFAGTLRSFLRQDPNIILVGEIRDLETAEIAVKAALTGHLLLSTLHTNDAPSSIVRLTNMGIEPFLVASALNIICAQRLVRLICEHCQEEYKPPPELIQKLGIPEDEINSLILFKGTGCKFCADTGFKGRSGLYEVMDNSPAIQELILSEASASELRRVAKSEGMLTLREAGINKLKEGRTTIDEVLRETTMI
ncbi:MAG: type IV-A pilus assembly ATPase PilB [Acidobacteriota bacterium]